MICKIPIENAEERQKRLALLKKKIKLSLQLKDEGKMSVEELSVLKREIIEFKEVETVERCRFSLLEFAYEFFDHDKNSEFYDDTVIPAGVKIDDAPQFHRELCEYLSKVAYSKEGERLCWSVPRSHAKSTFISQLFPVWVQCFRLPISRYILILSESSEMAQKFLDFSRLAIKENGHERLIDHFGFGLYANSKLNERDNSTQYVSSFKNPYTNRGIRSMVRASGILGGLRGSKFGSSRVTCVIADDLESQRNTATKDLRDANIHFWTSVIDPISEPTGSFLYLGTMVHGQGLLPFISKRADYHSRTYAAITKYPSEKSSALWDEFERIYRDAENPNRDQDSRAFLEQNEDVMMSDVATLWNRFDYADLIRMKVNMGTKSFQTEMLNIPADQSASVFSEDTFHFYEDHELPPNLEIYSFWDIAISGTGDRNAIVTIGRNRRNGIVYILETKLVQCKMHEALELALTTAKRWRPRFFGIESVQMQIEAARQFESRLIKEGIYNINVKRIRPRGNKQMRIESMQPLVENGILRFKKNQQMLIEELISFPHGNFDDGGDSLQQCLNMVNFRRGLYNKPEGT